MAKVNINGDYSHEISTDTKVNNVECIQNWEERIQSGRYKPDNVQYLRMALSKFDEFERNIILEDWKMLTEDKKEGLKIW